jgi:hypothetical protein
MIFIIECQTNKNSQDKNINLCNFFTRKREKFSHNFKAHYQQTSGYQCKTHCGTRIEKMLEMIKNHKFEEI